LRRNVTPSMFGISTSSVMTSGLSSLMRSRELSGSLAVPTTSISGSDDSKLDSSCRISAESSTMRTRIGLPMILSLFVEEFDFAGGRVRCQAACIFGFLTHDGGGCGAAQQPPNNLASRRGIMNATRQLSAEVLGGASQSLGLKI